MGASEEEEARDKDGDEGTTTSGEDIDRPGEDAERDEDISDGEEDVDQDAVRCGGRSEADEWESVGSDGGENKESLEAEDTDEAG